MLANYQQHLWEGKAGTFLLPTTASPALPLSMVCITWYSLLRHSGWKALFTIPLNVTRLSGMNCLCTCEKMYPKPKPPASPILRARLVDYLFPMSKVLKIRVGRSGKKKKEKKGRSTYNRVSNFFICDRNAANAMARSTNMCTWCSWDTFPSVLFFSLFIQKIVQIWKMLNSQAPL